MKVYSKGESAIAVARLQSKGATLWESELYFFPTSTARLLKEAHLDAQVFLGILAEVI